jgi:hypothetical protein
MNEERSSTGRHRDAAVWWAVGGALLVAGFAFEWSRRYGYNVCDDSLISLQYARNAAGGLGFVFNPGERVEGFTNFLWVAVLALAHPIADGTSFGFVRLATTISIALAAIDIFLLYRLGRLIWPRQTISAGRTEPLECDRRLTQPRCRDDDATRRRAIRCGPRRERAALGLALR